MKRHPSPLKLFNIIAAALLLLLGTVLLVQAHTPISSNLQITSSVLHSEFIEAETNRGNMASAASESVLPAEQRYASIDRLSASTTPIAGGVGPDSTQEGLLPFATGGITETVYLPIVVNGDPKDSPSEETLTVTPEEGGLLVSSDGYLRLDVPAGAVDSTVTITYRQRPAQEAGGYQTVGRFFELTAQDENGNSVSQFNRDLDFTVTYEDVPGLDETSLALYYTQDDRYWWPISSTVDVDSNQILAKSDHFTEFAALSCTPPDNVGLNEDGDQDYFTDAFQAAYCRNGGESEIGLPVDGNKVHDWAGALTQDFDWAKIIYNPTGTAYYIQGEYNSKYFDIGGPASFLGLPTSDRYDPPASALLFDKHTNFMGYPIQEFEGGFIGNDTNGSNGDGYRTIYYYPVLKSAQVQVEHYLIPDPIDPTKTITKARVTLTAGNVFPNPPQNDKNVSGIWVSTPDSTFEGWIPDQGTTPKVWDNLDPNQEFSFRLEAWVDTGQPGGQAGYLPCDSYKKELAGEDHLYGPISLGLPGTYSLNYTCDGFGGGGGGGSFLDTQKPIIGEPEVWQNGKGWAIISAEVTDNVSVDWVKVTLNEEEHFMTWAEGNTYVAIVSLEFGRNIYFITASDPSGNIARYPDSGELEIWSDMAFSYGYRPWMAYSDDPVNTGIGNFVYNYTDVEIPALGPDIVLERWFNHQSRYDGPLGIGWTFLYDMHLLTVDNLLFSGVQLRYADGRVVNFEGDGSGGFTAPETVFDTLEQVGSEYLLTKKDRTVYRFNDEGRLISIADKDGNILTLNYSGEELSTMVDASGRALTFTYTDGHITTINIPDYGSIEYEYQDSRLIAATNTEGNQVFYEYEDETGCMVSITSPEGKPFLAEQTCDEDGRVTYQLGGTGYVNEFSYDDTTKTTTVTDPYGNQAVYVYDEEYRVVEERDALNHSVTKTYNDDYLPLTITDKNGNTTSYTYDNNGNRLTAADAMGNVTSYTYDVANNITSRTDALGNTTTYEYDSEGHLIKETDALGGETSYTYNNEGLLIRTVDPLGNASEISYNNLGLPVTETDALGNVAQKVYDNAGNLISETDPLGNVTTYEYNSIGQPTLLTDSEGNTTTYEYDADQNLIRETNAAGDSKTFTYDDNNRLVAETDWAGNVTTYVYDDLARKIAEIDPLGNQITYEYDAASNMVAQTDKRGATTTYTYDANGNMLTQTDALGNVTGYSYDALNRQIEVNLPGGRIEKTIYDALGRGIERIDARGNSTHFEYDAVGREIRRIDALGNETIRVYDLAGNLIEEIDALGNSTRFEYDPLNRQIAVTNRLGYTRRQEYDAAGRIIAEIDERGNRTDHVYDGNDRLLETIDALGNITSYTYDSRDNRLTITDALGGITNLTYDANSNVVSMTNPRGYTTSFTYDAMNQRITMTDALGNVTTFTYCYRPNYLAKNRQKLDRLNETPDRAIT